MNDHLSQPPGFSWRLFWYLFIAALIGIAGIIPAALQIFASSFDRVQLPAIPLPVIITLGVIQNLVLLGLFVGLGLKLSGKVGLDPILTQAVPLFRSPGHSAGGNQPVIERTRRL